MRDLRTNWKVEEASVNEIRFRDEYREMLADWLTSWKEAFSAQNFPADFFSGLTVAAVALPLNLALAVASGLAPSTGLLAGSIGGAIAAIFGGSRFQVTGPAAALNVIVFMVVKDFGVSGAAAAAIVAGVIALILSGLLAGKLIRFIPAAVLAGFTSGVGLKLLDQQLPELLGFDYRVVELISMMNRPTWLHEVSWLSVVCGIFVALLVVSTRQFKRFPAALIGIAIVTALSIYLNWNIERVGTIPPIIPTLVFPTIAESQWLSLILQILPLGLLGAMESLLSAQVLDRATPQHPPHNANLELFGQGLANIAAGLVGTMPVTGVVVRGSANVQSGARSRFSGLIHAGILLFSIFFLSDQMAQIPLAGLSGLLCVVGIRLIEVDEFYHLLMSKRVEALAFAFSMAGTVTGHLVAGLSCGIVLHLAYQFFTRHGREIEQAKEELRAAGIRAVLGRSQSAARRLGHYEPSTSGAGWLANVRERAVIPKSSFVHPEASLIGRVILGEDVHVAADTSIRADEGTPFYIGGNSNVQDGVVLHALKERHVRVGGEDWAIYVGKNVSIAHQALVHGPCYVGDNTFIGFKAVVHDSIVGANCFVGIGAVVVGVEIPDGRFVPHGAIVDTADKVDRLPSATHAHSHFSEDVVEVNRGLAAAYRLHESHDKFNFTKLRDLHASNAYFLPFENRF